MSVSRSLKLVLLVFWPALLATPAVASPIPFLQTHLSQSVFVAHAGDQITLSGFFTTSNDPLTWTYGNGIVGNQGEFLFGSTSSNNPPPHLGIVSGVTVLSQDFDPPNAGTYFEDVFGAYQGGYLGPTTILGPNASTPVSLLRTFLIPAGTAPGIYHYSYGVGFGANTNSQYQNIFDQSLIVEVTAVPEPGSMSLLASGLLLSAARMRRRRGARP